MEFKLNAEQIRWQNAARRFARDEVAPLSAEMDARGEIDPRLIQRMSELGFMGGVVGAEWGGSAMSYLEYALVMEELGWADQSVRGFLTVHAGLVSGLLHDWGTPEQKALYLPRLASGEWIGCYALTETNAGSDAAAMETTALRDGDTWLLNGEKIWITNGLSASLAIIFATLDPTMRHKGICAFLVETAAQGFSREKMPGLELGHRASEHAVITLHNCRVPHSALLGAEGEGFKIAMSGLDRGRLGVAAGAVGLAQACLDASVSYTRKRRQFGKRVADFGEVAAALADMTADVDAARLLVYRAAYLKDQGERATKEASIAKLFATEAAARAASEAVLLHGNRGYSNLFPVERHYRDIKGLQIYEGTSHIQRVIIARELVGKDD